jgi:REP element-mobilizing transposase RayT
VRPINRAMIERVVAKHALNSGAYVDSTGNAGNHLHLRVRVSSRQQYFRFIRSVTGEIALRIRKIANPSGKPDRSFWDRRPFSSIVSTAKYAARLKDYIIINHMEGQGFPRAYARLEIQSWRNST